MRSNQWTAYLIWLLPVIVGLAFAVPVLIFLPAVPASLTTLDLGFVAIVLGLTVRNAAVLVFLVGFLVTLIILVVIRWDRRRISEAQTLYADYVSSVEEKRRHFLRRLDHEIKNPLTGLRAALVNLQEAQAVDERWQAQQNAGRAVERLTRLLTDLRKLADLDERPIERYPVDVPDLLEDVVEAARTIPAYAGRNISLLIPKVPSPFPMITGDRDLLVLAVYNLVENALKFTAGNDSVEVRASEDGRTVVIEVADSGAGIPSTEVSKIFEELYRGSNARSTDGSGLGLALVHRIATLHGGGVGVRSSQQEPRGTVFTLRLPRR